MPVLRTRSKPGLPSRLLVTIGIMGGTKIATLGGIIRLNR
jgi:hypothetical protein